MDSKKQTEGFGGQGMRGWVSPVMGTKEDTYCKEHQALYINNESWNTSFKTNDALYGE